MKIIIFVIFLWIGPFSIGAYPAAENPEFRYGRNNDVSLKPGERDVIRKYLRSYFDANHADGGGNTALHVAANHGYEVFANLLIQCGADSNRANKNKNTPLLFATAKGFYRLVADLIQNGANVNVKNKFLDTPLHYAASRGHEDIVNLLIQNKVDINAVNEYGDVAIHFAAYNGHENIIRLLIRNGANVNIANGHGSTALHFAVQADKYNSIEVLLENGANQNIQNNNGKSAKDLAKERGHKNIIDLFLRYSLSLSQRACNSYSGGILEDRILGGELTEQNEFPWMVALGYRNEKGEINFECGGTLISELFILTAAHCATPNRQPIIARLGKTKLMDSDPTADHQIATVVRHPDYSPVMKKNDIALIRLVDPIEFTMNIRPACIQTDLHDENPNTNLTITGWGLVSTERRERSNELLKADLITFPLQECNTTVLEFNKLPNSPSLRNGVSESQYCAYDPNGKKDSCQGDSGGPLQIYPKGSYAAKIVGVVSFGVNCGSTFPGIYTRVASYREWIETHVWSYDEH